MGLISRIQASRAETRVIGGVPWRLRPWDSPFWRFSQGGPVHPSRAFYGKDEALGLPALYACVRLLADSLASLPVKIYTRAPSGDRSAVRYTGPSIFDQPSITGTLYDWLFTAMTSLLLQGNAWGYVTSRDGYGYPQGIEWIPPEDVNVQDDEQQPWNPLRARIYVYGRLMSRDELFHIKAFSVAGRTEGISPLRAFAQTVLAGIEAQRYGTDWYRAGGFPPGVFRNTEIEIDETQAEEIRALLVNALRRREPLVHGRDWEYSPVTVPPSEAQFIAAMQMNATHMASVYGLPADRVGGTRGDSLTYSTVEQGTLQIIEALRPWMVRLEHAFFNLLPQNRYTRFDSDALLKTDLHTRTQIYQLQRNIGLRTIDELRDLEDLPPMDDGVGDESIPLEVMVAMSRSIRGIPKSMMPQLVLEMDLAADRLAKLQPSGKAAPNMDPGTISPEAMLGRIVAQQRDGNGGERSDADVIMEFLTARRAHRDQAAAEGTPDFVGAWIPSRRDLINPNPGGEPRATRAMYTAHRIDDIGNHLAHASERLTAAKSAGPGDLREYESEHVLVDLEQAADHASRLARNICDNYPAEGAEYDTITGMTTRDKALTSGHKAATFAHLLQTVIYHQGHARRHAQVMTGECDSPDLWGFDADHCAKHTAEALEHTRKLAEHVRDNYPAEAKWLARLDAESDLLAGTGSNGNGRH